ARQRLSGKDVGIQTGTGLLGRWGLNEPCSTQVIESSGNGRNGTLMGTNCTFAAGAPFSATPNTAPVVNAGPDQAVTLPAAASLIGSYTDDGVPGTGVPTLWTKTSGPGPVTCGTAAALSPPASSSAPG